MGAPADWAPIDSLALSTDPWPAHANGGNKLTAALQWLSNGPGDDAPGTQRPGGFTATDASTMTRRAMRTD